MSYEVLVEPSDQHRRAFARWCLAQNPRIETATASGSLLNADQFKAVPDELLEGSFIDGRPFRPAIDGLEPDGDGYAEPSQPAPAKKTAARRRSRKVPEA